MPQLVDTMTYSHRLAPDSRSCARSRRGAAILPALIVVVVVATLSMMYVQVSLAKNKEQRGSVDSKRAFYMAEAGLAEGFNGLCLGKSGNVGSPDVPATFGRGIFWTTATEIGQGRVALQSTGLCGAGRATLQITVERKPDTTGALGFFGTQDITVQPGALIDGYNSYLGSYATQAALAPLSALVGQGAKLGGNADIHVDGTLTQPTKIYGNANPGPAGTLFRSASVTLVGSTAPTASLTTLPPVRVPDLPSRGALAVTSADPIRVLSPAAFALGSVTVEPSCALTIQGPALVVVDSIDVQAGGTLKFDATNGRVRVVVKNGLNLAPASMMGTTTTDPLSVTVEVAGTAGVSIGATGNFYGNIYVPNTAVSVPSTLAVYGSVVAQSLTLQSGAKLHFDRALTMTTSESNGTPKLLGWHIIELPNVATVQLRFDALADLLRRGITPLKAATAHLDLGETAP